MIIVTGITLVFTFHMRCISIVRSLYFKIFSAYYYYYYCCCCCCCWKQVALVLGTGITFTWRNLVKQLYKEYNVNQSINQSTSRFIKVTLRSKQCILG